MQKCGMVKIGHNAPQCVTCVFLMNLEYLGTFGGQYILVLCVISDHVSIAVKTFHSRIIFSSCVDWVYLHYFTQSSCFLFQQSR